MRDFKFFGGLAALLLFLVVSVPFTFAGLAVSPGTANHNHSDANTGGSTLDVGSLMITSADSRAIFIESDATADNKRWDWQANAEKFLLRTVNDAGSLAGTAITVERSGTVVDEILLSATNTSVTGTLSVTGGLTAGSITTNGSASTGALSASTIAASGTVSSTKGCASGHARSNPNYCYVTAPASTSLVRDACTAVAAASGDAKVTDLLVTQAVYSANAIALRYSDVAVYSDSTCATLYTPGTAGGQTTNAREFAAVAAGTLIASDVPQYTIPLPSNGATVYLRFSDDAGNQGTASFYRIGYGD